MTKFRPEKRPTGHAGKIVDSQTSWTKVVKSSPTLHEVNGVPLYHAACA